MSVSFIPNTNSALVFASSVGAAGSWATVTNAGAVAGNFKKATVIGDKVTITWTGRSLYLITVQEPAGAEFSVTTDGVNRYARSGSCHERGREDPNGVFGYFRVPILIERDLTDGSHTTVIQSIAVTNTSGSNTYLNLNIDGINVVTGAKIGVLSSSTYTAMGDSWTYGYGATLYSEGYAYKLGRMISNKLKSSLTLNNISVAGTGIITGSTNNLFSAMEAIVSAATTGAKYNSFMYGVNDLGSQGKKCSAAQWYKYFRTCMQFIEDVFDVNTAATGLVFLIYTPGYISNYYKWKKLMVNSSTNQLYSTNWGGEEYEMAVNTVLDAYKEFPWMKVVDCYSPVNENPSFVVPSAASDFGFHPTNSYHELIAQLSFNKVFGY